MDARSGHMTWFPYRPRPHQDEAVEFAARVFNGKTVGLLSADCGVGKTVAVLAGFLASRAADPTSRLVVLTRTHSQTRVFENELSVLREHGVTAGHSTLVTATSMASRVHICPLRDSMGARSNVGFNRACAELIQSRRCRFYNDFYVRGQNGRYSIRDRARDVVSRLASAGLVTREAAERTGAEEGLCPYELLRWSARRSLVVIGPYGYMFQERARRALLSSLGVRLLDVDLVVDEAHNLPEHVLSSHTVTLSGEDIEWLRKNSDDIVRDTGMQWLGETVDFVWDTMVRGLETLHSGERRLNIWDVVPRFADVDALRRLRDMVVPVEIADDAPALETPLDRLVELLLTGHLASKGSDWLVTLESHGYRGGASSPADLVLRVRPLNAAGLAAPVLRGARSALLMSGTLRPLSHYSRLLGVADAITADLASPYPHGTRLVLLDRTVSTKYTERSPSMWRRIAERVTVALCHMPADKSALVAFPSYAIMQEVLSYGVRTGMRERVVETRDARLEELQAEVEAGPRAIFCVYGGKFSEGIDLVRGGSSMVDLIVGVGIPFSPPTLHQRALQDWYEERFGEGLGYYYASVVPSVRQVAQLVGRLRRSPSDWGVVLLLDRRFQQYLTMFGDDAVADVWPYSSVDELREAISMFVSSRSHHLHPPSTERSRSGPGATPRPCQDSQEVCT